MNQSRTRQVTGAILGCLLALALAVSGFLMKAEGHAAKQSKAAVPAEQVIAAIRAAVTAKAGHVRAVELEHEGDRTICEVEILGEDGKVYEVEVDVANGSIVEIEEDDDDHDNDHDND